MGVVKILLTIVYIIVCLVIIVLTFMQRKDQEGLSGAIAGSSSSDNFYEKNKGRTREGALKKYTIIFGIAFGVLTLALGIIYVIK